MALSAATVQEIIRKAQLGIPLTSPTPEKMAIYNQYAGKTPQSVTNPGAYKAPSSPQVTSSTATNNNVPQGVLGSGGTTKNTTSTPSTPNVSNISGYRGAVDYYNATPQQRQQIVQNEQRLRTDPAYKQSEIERTISVIQQMRQQGLDTSAQEKYLRVNLGYQGEIPTSLGAGQPTEQPKMTPEELGRLMQQLWQQQMDYFTNIARGEYERELAERQRIAQQQMQALQQAYERANQIQRDLRVLEDLRFARQNSPFTGQTEYAATELARQRQLADEAARQDYMRAIAGIQQGLADFQNTAAQSILARAYQLMQDARRYGLDYASLFGNLPPELAVFFPGGGPQTLAAQAQAFNQAMAYADRFGTLPGGGPLTLEAQRFQRDIYESDREYAYRLARDKIADERYKQEFDEDVRRFNLEYALEKAVKNRQLSQEDARIALERANLGLRQQELELARQREARLSQQEQPSTRTAEDLRTYFDSMVQRDPVTGAIINRDQLERAILASGLPEYEIYKLYLRYGLPWNGPIPRP